MEALEAWLSVLAASLGAIEVLLKASEVYHEGPETWPLGGMDTDGQD